MTHDHDVPEWERDLAERLVAIATEMYERHEAEEHDGERCQEHRAGLVAFLAHRIGVRDQTSVRMAIEALVLYEREHAAHEDGG